MTVLLAHVDRNYCFTWINIFFSHRTKTFNLNSYEISHCIAVWPVNKVEEKRAIGAQQNIGFVALPFHVLLEALMSFTQRIKLPISVLMIVVKTASLRLHLLSVWAQFNAHRTAVRHRNDIVQIIAKQLLQTGGNFDWGSFNLNYIMAELVCLSDAIHVRMVWPTGTMSLSLIARSKRALEHIIAAEPILSWQAWDTNHAHNTKNRVYNLTSISTLLFTLLPVAPPRSACCAQTA